MTELSQVQIIGLPRPKSWDDYEKGCLATFGGGHHADGHLEAYQHGMQTVFNLLRAEFPSAEQCKTCAILLDTLRWHGPEEEPEDEEIIVHIVDDAGDEWYEFGCFVGTGDSETQCVRGRDGKRLCYWQYVKRWIYIPE